MALGPGCRLEEAELEQLRDQMAVLAGIVLDEWQAVRRAADPNLGEADPRKAG